MKKILSILTLSTVLLFALSALADDPKVVVIPLLKGGATSSTPASSSGVAVSVYDADDTFVGYYISQNIGRMNELIIVSQNSFYTHLRNDTTGVSYFDIGVRYDSPGCTGNAYVSGSVEMLFAFPSKGSVFRSDHEDNVIYYIPKTATLVTLPAGTYYNYDANQICQSVNYTNPIQDQYPVVLNNSTDTGFKNSYTPPLKGVYSLPNLP